MLPDGYRITTELQEMDFAVIHGFIVNSYWARGIPEHTLRVALSNSLNFAALDEENHLVGFARMVTDRATFAYLADVFVVDTHRGIGLSKALMHAVSLHPELQGLRRTMLATRDAHGLYAQFGFEPVSQPQILMQKWDPEIYQSS